MARHGTDTHVTVLAFQCSVLSTCSALHALTEPQTSLVFCMDYGRKYNFGIYWTRNALRNLESFQYCSRFKRKVLSNSIIFMHLHNFVRLLINIFCETLVCVEYCLIELLFR